MSLFTPLDGQHFFKDNDGHWAIWQLPNLPLYGWLLSELLTFIVKQQRWHTGLTQLSRAFLFTWAFLEVTQGVSYFRRLLGAIVLAAVVSSYFM